MDIMSVMEGFTYSELRNLPLDELLWICENVDRISIARKKEME